MRPLSIPCGFSSAGLPLCLMISGRPFDEATVLRTGYGYQSATDWHPRHPPLRDPLRCEGIM